MNCKKLIICTLILLFAWPFGLKPAVAGETRKANYFLTISVLQELYNAKIMVSNRYSKLSQKALEERDYGLAGLFSALSKSGSIHAKNFKYILNDLGIDMKDFTKPEIKISNSKENLEFSLFVAFSEIDTYYPKFIKRIKPEGNESALKEITYVWKAEMQHRNLMEKMKPSLWSPIGKFFDNSKEAYVYHVCQRCGATVFQLPEKTCIICRSPVSIYKQIKPQALFDFVGGDTGKPDRSNDHVVARPKEKPFRPMTVPRMHEWFITSFTLNPIIFDRKADLAYEPTGLEGSILTHYIEQELKLRINPKIPIKVGDTFSDLKNKKSGDETDSIIFCVSGEIQDLLITSRKSETWGVLKVKYVFAEQRINPSYTSRETKQIQIIPSDNSTAKTPEAILVQKNLTRDDMEKLLQNAAKEIVNRIVLKIPAVQERTK